MGELSFDCLDVWAEAHAASPTLTFRLRVAETTGQSVQSITLRCQMRITPRQRRYTEAEKGRLYEVFGEAHQWGETLNPIQFTYVSIVVPGFEGSTEIDFPVPCTYDMEVSTAKFFHALEEGEVPLELMFSGTVFYEGETGFAVEQVPWHKEATYRLPVAVWRQAMDYHFPGSTWIRLRRDTFDQLAEIKSQRALPTWEATLEQLLVDAKEASS